MFRSFSVVSYLRFFLFDGFGFLVLSYLMKIFSFFVVADSMY